MPKKKVSPKKPSKDFKKKKVSDKASFSTKVVGGKADRKEDNLDAIRHTASHVLAYAVKQLFPTVKFGIGPVIDTGFYYDFDLPRPLRPDDLPKIEKKMKEIIRQNLPMEKIIVPMEKAKHAAKQAGQKFKLEILEEIESGERARVSPEINKGEVTFYRIGEFTDLCKGNHARSTGEIPIDAFKLTHFAGAYWKGSESREQLQRVYGALFTTNQKLQEYLKQMEEARKRDHKKLGPQMGLFMFHPTAPGMPYWLPKGMIVLNGLMDYWRKDHAKRGYEETSTPQVNKKELWVTSGHWEHYKDDMFIADLGKDEIYGIKAMNCPNAMIIFGHKTRSYKELPLRLSDADILHRYEGSGMLNGLLRARAFRQDDAHVFVTENQIESEYKEIFDITEHFYKIFGLQFRYRLSTRPENFMGDSSIWEDAENILKKILDKQVGEGKYELGTGEGAFYGPKVDILMKDSLGRDWQMGTIQLDFNQPERFKLKYVDKDGSLKTPAVIHRVIYGSLERFIGVLIEHYAGALPTWLMPVQTIVLPISDKLNKYGYGITKELYEAGIRVEIDDRNESVGKKIREAEMQKVPYMLVVGKKEAKAKKITVRKRGEREQKTMAVSAFFKQIQKEIKEKK
ncbi:MAG: threonine--tRNA ligase [Candidatus Doudnabacteria bacterium CG10_big_fil_rev_8_21_14_0_10_41_10]|uniref:Threonine--tRNA ligase n=1 Tax=Candidatus Doudnabacteria bacterium CG10_big_fil_rev_8_21_14_0_10_41_10 TaxID=1974551 RepID=A0A2H0VCV5_9BACT|nr:MAG: threonine--tRNA ligase [Candidatus Doudnabacteria bacterium CG10_big_fil_rev_8_21_14_0_10_41_10]